MPPLLGVWLVFRCGALEGIQCLAVICNPFQRQPDFVVASINYSLVELLSKAISPEASLGVVGMAAQRYFWRKFPIIDTKTWPKEA